MSSLRFPLVQDRVQPGAARPQIVRAGRITVEQALYLLFIAIAIISRFWNLGERALHHDESLHAYYSWLYATGGGYIHDPLMHGPFLFHLTGLNFLLIGATDATARYGAALFGVILVALPYLLRGPRQLGRSGALAASALLLISPAFLYQSRYIRHDIFTAVGTLLLFACIVRYLEQPERRWLVTGGVTLALLLANHEVIFIILVAFAAYLWGALLWGRFRPLIVSQFVALALAGVAVAVVPRQFDSHLPVIPWQNPTRSQELTFARDLVTSPLLLSLVVILASFIIVSRAILRRERGDAAAGSGWLAYLFGQLGPGSVEQGVLAVWTARRTLLLTIAIGVLIWIALFTTLFTNLGGIGSGSFGALFYWLAQQHVQRGHQPWFYYIILLPQYEFIATGIGGAACLVALWRAGRCLIRHRPVPARLFMQLFLVVWFVVVFGVLSWAGEKMPWLVIHVSLPLTLLAAELIGELIERAIRQRRVAVAIGNRPAVWAGPTLAGLLLLAITSWFFVSAQLTYGEFVPLPNGQWQRIATSYAASHWWFLAVPPLVILGLILTSWLLHGMRATATPVFATLVLVLALLQLHGAIRMTYEQGDIPYDMLIYTQTSPDVTRVMSEIDTLSRLQTGGLGLSVWYDYQTAWPLQWYLRDYPNKLYYGTKLTGPPTNAAVLFVANEDLAGVQPQMQGYTAQEYVLRWWFPEFETYRNFAIAPEVPLGWSAWKSKSQPHGPLAIIKSVGSSIATQFTLDGQQRLYRLLMYRDLPAPLGTANTVNKHTVYLNYDFTLYIRNDLLPLFNQIRYGPA